MDSNLYPEPAVDGESSKLNCEAPAKKVFVQAQLQSKFFNERLATPRVRCAIFLDEARPLRYRKPSRRLRSDPYVTESEVFVSSSSSGICQKPWPSRKAAEVEEVVKYMSSVPCYLQRVEKGENVQEKALNFGVIDWRHLEKWTNNQNTDQKNVIFSAVNMEESPSSSYSGRSISKSPARRKQASCRSSSDLPAERKQSFSSDGHWDRSDKLNSRTLPVRRSLWSSHEKFQESKHESRTSMQIEEGTSVGEEKSKSCDHGCALDHHLQEISCVRSKTLPSIHGDRKGMEVEKLPKKYSHQSSVSHDILQSGLCDKSKTGTAAFSIKNGVTSTKFMTKSEECKQITKSSGNYVVNTDEQSSNQKVEAMSGGKKEPLPNHPSSSGLKWLNRSSSLKDVSSSHELKDTNGLNISDEKGRCHSRGRRSPLRRMLDPLLKSKYDGNSGPISVSPVHLFHEYRITKSFSAGKESSSMNSTHRSSDASISSSNTLISVTTQDSLQDERYGAPMRQALVKLGWKNGQPLFMFSTNDNSVLVASMRSSNRLGKEEFGGVYTIVSAQESKKKGGIWIKKPNLLYDVVGRLEVSCSKLSSCDSKNLEISKQYVLVSDELLPSHGCVDSVHSSQVAAIVVKAPYLCRDGDHESLAQGKCSSLRIGSLQVEQYPAYSRSCSISAILPSGIHGFSDLGKPSTLIERWKSGGSCDCGGWDEGCRLTILADRLHEMNVASSVEECSTTDGFRRIELFRQGGKAGQNHAFSMISFKEGLYTIEFGSQITSLQAFAICISTLHCRNSIEALDFSANHRSLEDPLYENYPKMNSMQNNGGPTSCESHHPPFSPVGRS